MRPQEPHCAQGFDKKTNGERRRDGAWSSEWIRLAATKSNSQQQRTNLSASKNTENKVFTSNHVADGWAFPTEVAQAG